MVTGKGTADSELSDAEISGIIEGGIPPGTVEKKRVLVLTPDGTRTAPLPPVIRILEKLLGKRAARIDYMVALGSHRQLTADEILNLYGIGHKELSSGFAGRSFSNHRWDSADTLVGIGTLSAREVRKITDGALDEEVPIEINRRVFEYDLVLILGPVFPHEVMGFSGGFKYLFPGISGGRFLHLFHWLGALNTCIRTIGIKETPTRRLVRRAAELLTVPLGCISMVVNGRGRLAGLFAGDTEESWSAAADLSSRVHIVYKKQPFGLVIGEAPERYDELWTAGKVMYKLEPVVRDGGRLVILGRHIKTISHTWGDQIEKIGYHVKDYFLERMDRFGDVPKAVLAHSTHVKGLGSMVNGRERPRIDVILATSIPEKTCRRINLGYMNPDELSAAYYGKRRRALEEQGILFVEDAGEILYRTGEPSPAG